MTKQELAGALASKTGLAKDDAIVAIEGLMAAVKETLAQKEDIYLRGFGTFKVVKRKAKKGQNITRREEIDIPERYAVKFKPCNELKEMVK